MSSPGYRPSGNDQAARAAAQRAQAAADALPTHGDVDSAIGDAVKAIPAATSMRLFTQASVQPGDSKTAATTTEQTFTSQYVVPANSLMVGQSVRVTGSGVYSTSTVAPPTQRARLRLGGQTLVDTGPVTVIASLSAARFMFDVTLTIRALGNTGQVEAFGLLHFATSLAGTIPILCGPSGAFGEAGNPVTVDLSTAQPLTCSVQFGAVPSTSALQAANSSVLRQLHVHTLRPAT